LLLAAVTVGILAGLDDRLLGSAENLAAGVVVALGLGQDLLVTASGDDATLDSCHVRLPREWWRLAVRQELDAAAHIALVNEAGPARTQLALGLARLVAEVVPATGGIGLVTLGGLAQTLRSRPVRLQLGHDVQLQFSSFLSQGTQHHCRGPLGAD